MSVQKINNIFTKEELDILNNRLNYSAIPTDSNFNYANHRLDQEGRGIHDELGRLQFGSLKDLPLSIVDKINKIVENASNKELSMSHAIAVEYSSLYGLPNLPVHYDYDTNDLIINFQLLSNTKWNIGVDLKIYELEDNSALVFNGNEHTHWRPHKTFKDNEFIKMIFFRFADPNNPSDYSHLDYVINHEIFAEINAFRDSLGNT
jgi:hypothetical protein